MSMDHPLVVADRAGGWLVRNGRATLRHMFAAAWLLCMPSATGPVQRLLSGEGQTVADFHASVLTEATLGSPLSPFMGGLGWIAMVGLSLRATAASDTPAPEPERSLLGRRVAAAVAGLAVMGMWGMWVWTGQAAWMIAGVVFGAVAVMGTLIVTLYKGEDAARKPTEEEIARMPTDIQGMMRGAGGHEVVLSGIILLVATTVGLLLGGIGVLFTLPMAMGAVTVRLGRGLRKSKNPPGLLRASHVVFTRRWGRTSYRPLWLLGSGLMAVSLGLVPVLLALLTVPFVALMWQAGVTDLSRAIYMEGMAILVWSLPLIILLNSLIACVMIFITQVTSIRLSEAADEMAQGTALQTLLDRMEGTNAA